MPAAMLSGPSCEVGFLDGFYGILPLYDTNEHHNDRKDKEEVDESAKGVGRNEAKRPEDKKQNGDSE